jgi:hypothetical protein
LLWYGEERHQYIELSRRCAGQLSSLIEQIASRHQVAHGSMQKSHTVAPVEQMGGDRPGESFWRRLRLQL